MPTSTLSSGAMADLQATITVPFTIPLEDNSRTTLVKCVAFWDLPSTLQWFSLRGYTLYKRKDPEYEGEFEHKTYPALECAVSGKMDYPFPHHDSGTKRTGKLHARNFSGKVVYAQENGDPSHHVAIKLIMTDSEEHRILAFLQSQSQKTIKENCLVPVLNIFANGPYSFVVMPRWGNCVYEPEGGPIQNCFRIMHSLLKALAFLHRHNILHRDIKLENALVSHFFDEDDNYYNESPFRMELQWDDRLQYFLFDFDLSMMLPPDTDRTRYRLPHHLSWQGSGWEAHDTSQGEFDYDPFAFDVGTLGCVFCAHYQHLSRDVPMLAPFLDRMTTRNISKRFTAVEALEFFENFLPQISRSTLYGCFWRDPEQYKAYDVYDRWKDLSPDFIKEWKDYKESRIPLGTVFLRWLCSFQRMAVVVPAVRLFFYRITRFCFRAAAPPQLQVSP